MLTFPYIFAAVLYAQKKAINPFLACVIGIMAGMGFGLKPYFLIPLVLIESYLIIAKRHIFGWLRIESFFCLSTLIFYLIILCLYHPNYINELLPLIVDFYFPSVAVPWAMIFSWGSTWFCVLIMIYYFFRYDKAYYREFVLILFLSFIGF